MDDDGNIMTGALGEPLLLDGSAKTVDDGDLKAYLDLQFQFVDLDTSFVMMMIRCYHHHQRVQGRLLPAKCQIYHKMSHCKSLSHFPLL